MADATALARALYLTIEILEIGHPVVIALNMTDEARRDGIDIDVARLEAAHRRPGRCRRWPARVSAPTPLRAALAAAIERNDRTAAARRDPVLRRLQVDLAELEGLILSERVMDRPQDARVWAQWLLLSLDHDVADELTASRASIRAAVHRVHERATEAGRNLDLEIIGGRYQLVDRLDGRGLPRSRVRSAAAGPTASTRSSPTGSAARWRLPP